MNKGDLVHVDTQYDDDGWEVRIQGDAEVLEVHADTVFVMMSDNTQPFVFQNIWINIPPQDVQRKADNE